MSSQTDMQALVAKNTRLQAQLEIAESRSASRIKELELEVNALELDKRMSAAMPIARAPQPAVPIGPSYSVLQGQIARLQQEIAVKDAWITELEEEVIDLLEKFSQCYKASAAMTQFVGNIVKGTVAAEEHKPPREPTPKIAATGSNSAAKPISTSPATGSNDNSRTGSHTPASGLTSPKSAAEATYTPTVSSKPDYAQVLQMPRNNPPPRRPSYYKGRFHSPVTHAQLSAEKAAKQQGYSGQRTQQQSQKPNRGGNLANQRGRGDEDRGRGKATVSANPESRAGPEVTRATEGMNQLSLRSDMFPPMSSKPQATSEQLPQGIKLPSVGAPESSKAPAQELETGDFGLSKAALGTIDRSLVRQPPATSGRSMSQYGQSGQFGAFSVAPKVSTNESSKGLPPITPGPLSASESNRAQIADGGGVPVSPPRGLTTADIRKVKPEPPTTAPSSVMTSVPRLAPTQESSNAPSAIDRKVADSLAPVSRRQVSNQALWDESDPEEPAKTEVPDLRPKRVKSFVRFNPLPGIGPIEPDDEDKKPVAMPKAAREQKKTAPENPTRMETTSLKVDPNLRWSDEEFEDSENSRHL